MVEARPTPDLLRINDVILDPYMDAVFHIYRDKDCNVFESVTQIVKHEWPVDTGFYTDQARKRGTDVHTATELIDKGHIAPGEFVADDIYGRIQAWEAYKAEHVDHCVWIEQSFIHTSLHYAGTVDRIIWKKSGGLTCIELKSGAYEPWHDVQLGGYAVAAMEAGLAVTGLEVVRLTDAGNPIVHTVNMVDATSAWLHLIRWRNYRQGRKR